MESTSKIFYLVTKNDQLIKDVLDYFKSQEIKIDFVDKNKKRNRLNINDDIFDEDIFDEVIFDNEPEEIEGDTFYNINFMFFKYFDACKYIRGMNGNSFLDEDDCFDP